MSRLAALRGATILVVAIAAIATTLALGASPAAAAQTIQVSASPSSPFDGVPTTVTVTGTSDSGGSVYATLDGAASTCGSNPSVDGGSAVISGDGAAGPSYTDTATLTPVQGDYVLCAWLMPAGDDGSGTPLVGPTATPLTVDALQAKVTLSAPVSVSYQHPIPVTVAWHASAAGSLLVDALPASYGPCTADPADEPQYLGWLSGQDGYTNSDSVGQDSPAGTQSYVAGEFAPGTYVLCAWVVEPSGNVVAGPVSVSVRMLALPSPHTYSGRTSQQLPLSLATDGYDVQDIIYSARFACGAPEYFASGLRWNGVWSNTVLTSANFGTLRLSGGRLAANLDSNPANTLTLRATLQGRALTGTLRAVMRVGPPQFKRPATCRTGAVHFEIAIHGRRR